MERSLTALTSPRFLLRLRQAFDALDTRDFEIVMRALRAAAALIRLYRQEEPELAARLEADADGLREVLVPAIAQNHPERPGDIPDGRYQACRAFLSHFARIYTVSYDLLLYWAIMKQELPPPEIPSDDGFRKPRTPMEA
jgi:predicted component of type VI protein secretion system